VPDIARTCIAIGAGILLLNLVAWAARDGARFGREERLCAFLIFAAVTVGYLLARQTVSEDEFDALVDAQQHDLAESASQLSREIVAYVDARAGLAPPRPQHPATWDSDSAAWADFERETVAGYLQRFSRRVRATRAQMTFRNLRDRDLDTFYQQPGNTFQIRVVGERIGELATRLQRALASQG
jgi:hypothetical protein